MSEWEELADDVVNEVNDFIDVENHLIRETHHLKDLLYGLDHIFAHLDEITEDPDLHEILFQITNILLIIRRKMEGYMLKELRFMKEEGHLLQELEYHKKMQDWRAVKRNINREEREERKSIRLHKREIHWLHRKFNQIIEILEKGKVNFERTPKTKVKYYFHQLYRIFKAYEQIFWNLLLKERELHAKLKKLKREYA